MCGCGGRAPVAKRTRRHLGHVQGQSCRFISGHPSVKTTKRTAEEQRATAREDAKQYRERHPGVAYEIVKRSRTPEQNRAYAALHHALRTGKLTREPCEECGAEKAQAHHADYSKPLEVRWLCPVHHAALHHA